MNSTNLSIGSVKVAQTLFYLNAAIWLVICIVTLFRMPGGQAAAQIVMAVLMLGNSAAMLVAGLEIGKRRKPFFYFGVALLLINIILTVTDEFGLLDEITLVLDVILLGLLFAIRNRIRSYTILAI